MTDGFEQHLIRSGLGVAVDSLTRVAAEGKEEQ